MSANSSRLKSPVICPSDTDGRLPNAMCPGTLNLMMCKCLALLLYLMLSIYPCSAQDTAEVAKIQEQLANALGGKEADLRSRMAKARSRTAGGIG